MNWKDLPRKKKKRLYGKRGKRKHLVLELLDNPKIINKLLNTMYHYPNELSLSYLTNSIDSQDNIYSWKIKE